MARRKSVNFIRDIGVDPRYGSRAIAKLINVVMWRGKKNVARNIVYEALEIIERKAGDKDKAMKVFERALEQIRPAIEVRPRRVGGSVYQIPGEVSDRRAESLSNRWLVASSAKRRDKTMGMRLAHEILDAYRVCKNRIFISVTFLKGFSRGIIEGKSLLGKNTLDMLDQHDERTLYGDS